MPCTNCVERREFDRVVAERDELKHANICLRAAYEHEHRLAHKYFEQAAALQRDSDIVKSDYRKVVDTLEARDAELRKHHEIYKSMSNRLHSQLEDARERCKHYAEQATRYQNERDRAYEDATRQRTDYTNLMSECAKLKKMKDDFCIEACELRSALHARNALLQIMFLATGLHDCMLKELFNCHFHTSEASFDADLTRRMIQHCINSNSVIIDTLTGFRFDIAERLRKAIEVRSISGKPAHQARPKEAEGKEAKPNARCRRNKKKRDVRAKPEQSQRHAEGVAKKRSFKKKEK